MGAADRTPPSSGACTSGPRSSRSARGARAYGGATRRPRSAGAAPASGGAPRLGWKPARRRAPGGPPRPGRRAGAPPPSRRWPRGRRRGSPTRGRRGRGDGDSRVQLAGAQLGREVREHVGVVLEVVGEALRGTRRREGRVGEHHGVRGHLDVLGVDGAVRGDVGSSRERGGDPGARRGTGRGRGAARPRGRPAGCAGATRRRPTATPRRPPPPRRFRRRWASRRGRSSARRADGTTPRTRRGCPWWGGARGGPPSRPPRGRQGRARQWSPRGIPRRGLDHLVAPRDAVARGVGGSGAGEGDEVDPLAADHHGAAAQAARRAPGPTRVARGATAGGSGAPGGLSRDDAHCAGPYHGRPPPTAPRPADRRARSAAGG